MSTTRSSHHSSPPKTRPPSTGQTPTPNVPASFRAASADSRAAPTPGSTSCALGDGGRPRPGDDPPSRASEEVSQLSATILWRYHIQRCSTRAIARQLGLSHVMVWSVIQRHATDRRSETHEDRR
jgi:hypothetical protein